MENLKVLIVDDDPLVQSILSAMLQEQGLAVLEAKDAKEALNLIKLSVPELVFMDVFLADISGLELAGQIIAHCESESKPSPKIIFVSANDREDVQEMDSRVNIEHYLKKPFKSAAVKEILAEVRNGQTDG